MSASSRMHSMPRRSFGVQDSTDGDNDLDTSHHETVSHRPPGRISFGSWSRRPSFLSRWGGDEERPPTAMSERPPIPTMMQPSNESNTTPLPLLSMIVLSITMLGEFLSANVSTPFLLFMVKGFGESTDEADAAFWTGILVSTFFMTQFLTSLLWATVAEKHGRRVVLMVSLLGSAFTCLVFGTSTSLQQAICIRLLQGIFAGAVGVARGSVAFVTDASNEGRAYAILGFCWGFGGVAGAIIGGSFESPATKWPGVFQDIPLFVNYPYLLPCGLAASITFTGSILACFLGRDGGPREGAIRLLPEKLDHQPSIPEEESVPSSPIGDESRPGGLEGLRRSIPGRIFNFLPRFLRRIRPPLSQPAVPLTSPSRTDRARTLSRTSRINGSAYGYSANARNRLTSNAALSARKGSMASTLRRRGTGTHEGIRNSTGSSDLNFAQRLLIANEHAVTNIADLWVAAAMNVDNENPFESDSEFDSDNDIDSEAVASPPNDTEVGNASGMPTTRGRRPGRAGSNTTMVAPRVSTGHRPPNSSSSLQVISPHRSTSRQVSIRPSVSFSQSMAEPMSPRRFSSNVPSIFAHSGVRTPPAVLDAQQLLSSDFDMSPGELLEPIAESRIVSQDISQSDVESVLDKPPSLASQLPILIIVQYGVLALHTTTHDQVFMSYLVSDYDAGGLNLNAAQYAQLIALMCLAQIAYQFYLYPNIGPPRGRFSHLSMFRLGSILFIPSYVTVVLFRPFASRSGDGNFLVMAGLALSTALRFCGITFAYTSISILLNYMTPPNAVGYANGIAQSIVSLARCLGPVIGGFLWSATVQDDPSGYYLGFLICAGVCGISVLQSFLIR